MKHFELFVYSTGCATIYCDKSKFVHGDYKKLAIISNKDGKITFLSAPDKIPGAALIRIEHDSDAIRANAERR